ncbi:MAG: calcium-translocating P-type ATPase, PMCA-type [Oscillospiraceae bacterium]|nr:calcium-translocating P-type ATPase, PMCA-type [Oscillospiraceae bacterium]
MDWYNLSINEVEKKLGTNIHNGLSTKYVKKKFDEFGKNILIKKKKKSIFKRFFDQLSDFMVIILLFAAVVSFFSSLIEGKDDYIDTVIIVFIVLLNAIVGVLQESKAEKAIDALKKLSAPKATVIRNSKICRISSEEVVPGDIIVFSTGDFICADARLIESYGLKTEESSLTGESFLVEKSTKTIFSKNSTFALQKNMVFATSIVASGRGAAIVVETGMNTQVGKVAYMLNKVNPPKTHLQENLEDIGRVLGICALSICTVIFVLGILQDISVIKIFMISISLAVAAIPEGLPAIVTIILALGVRSMASRKAIVRKLPVVETLGSVSVICSDKTGTLTQNKMTVTTLANDKNLNFESKEAALILSLASLCNNSQAQKKGDTIGSPTEVAIVTTLENMGVRKSELQKKFLRVKEIPFDSKRKLMTTVHRVNNKRYRIITKGAPEILLPLCSRYKNSNINLFIKKSIVTKNEEMAKEGLRVLAVSYKDVESLPLKDEEVEKNLTFAGLIGMMDPPRREVSEAVEKCIIAGIKPVMITGDHAITAESIAKKLGILKKGDLVATGMELDKMSQSDLVKKIYSYSVFARVSPEHKVRIVKAFQEKGEVVAMTGDGVNDAPALKASDVGCAMGLVGTDVAKSAADMILTDDNFSTIVEAVRQGRGIYENIRKTVYFLLSSNIGEVITVLTSSIMYLPMPLLAIQLLWVNLITDSFPALALGVEPINKNVMKKKPISKNQGFFSNGAIYSMSIEGAFIGVISFLAFTVGRVFFDVSKEPTIGRTMAFVVLSLSQIFHVFNVRSEKSFLKSNIFENRKIIYSFVLCLFLQFSVVCIPEISRFFKTSQLNVHQWVISIFLSISPLFVVEIEKFVNKKSRKIKRKRAECVKNKRSVI